jgi:hypothetical protein
MVNAVIELDAKLRIREINRIKAEQVTVSANDETRPVNNSDGETE